MAAASNAQMKLHSSITRLEIVNNKRRSDSKMYYHYSRSSCTGANKHQFQANNRPDAYHVLQIHLYTLQSFSTAPIRPYSEGCVGSGGDTEDGGDTVERGAASTTYDTPSSEM